MNYIINLITILICISNITAQWTKMSPSSIPPTSTNALTAFDRTSSEVGLIIPRTSTTEFWTYSIGTNQWVQKSNAPVGTGGFGFMNRVDDFTYDPVTDNYFLAGTNTASNTPFLLTFTKTTQTWNLPVTMAGTGLLAAENFIGNTQSLTPFNNTLQARILTGPPVSRYIRVIINKTNGNLSETAVLLSGSPYLGFQPVPLLEPVSDFIPDISDPTGVAALFAWHDSGGPGQPYLNSLKTGYDPTTGLGILNFGTYNGVTNPVTSIRPSILEMFPISSNFIGRECIVYVGNTNGALIGFASYFTLGTTIGNLRLNDRAFSNSWFISPTGNSGDYSECQVTFDPNTTNLWFYDPSSAELWKYEIMPESRIVTDTDHCVNTFTAVSQAYPLEALTRPIPGTTINFNVETGQPGSIILAKQAYQTNTFLGINTPVDLTPLMLPGCTAYCGEGEVFLITTSSGLVGNATVPVSIPVIPNLLGTTYYHQWIFIDPIYGNMLDAAFTNMLTLTVGY